MNCKEINQLLSAYADGELSDELRDTVNKHIDRCAVCKELLTEQVKLHEQVLAISKTPALPDMESSIMSAIRNSGTQKKSRRWVRPVLVAAPVVLALAILLPIVIPNLALTPEKVLAKASAAGAAIKSYRMSGEHYLFDPVAKEYVLISQSGLEFTGDRYHQQLEFLISSGYYSELFTGAGTYEAIGDGDKAYGRITGSLGYAPGMAASEWQNDMPSEVTSRKELDRLVKIEELPEESVDGVLCYHFRGAVDIEKYNLNTPYYKTSAINEEYWIGKQDYIVRQMKTEVIREVVVGNSEFAKMLMGLASSLDTWKYSDFNAQITINVPLDGQGNLLRGWVVLPVK